MATGNVKIEGKNENSSIVNDLANDYSHYLRLDSNKEKLQFEDSIEEMLTRLDEYCGLVDLIRSDTSLCLLRTLPEVLKKGRDLEQIFDRIDKLQAFVAMVKDNVTQMDEMVEEAEAEMGSLSSIKKVFNAFPFRSLLSNKSQEKSPSTSNKQSKFNTPVIFTTDDYLKSASSTQRIVGAEASNTDQSASSLNDVDIPVVGSAEDNISSSDNGSSNINPSSSNQSTDSDKEIQKS